MSYPLSYKTVRDKTTLYAVIQDKETSKFWDEVANVWVDTLTSDCNLALTESSDKGVYTGAATFDPVKGGIYQISVFDSADAEYSMDTIEVYPSKTETVLEVINAIQLELRLPQSAALTDNFAKIILAKMNWVLGTLLPENNVFDHLKVLGSFTINSTRPMYRLSPVNVDFVETINFLRRPDMTYIVKDTSDVAFRTRADSHNASLTYASPEYYRIAQRDHGFPILEFSPAPASAEIISYEIIKSAKKLTLVTEYVPVPDVIRAGALMLMKQSQGRDVSAEVAIFEAAMRRAGSNMANSQIGDVEV